MSELLGVVPALCEGAALPTGYAQLTAVGNRPLVAYALDLMAEVEVREVALVGTARACQALRSALGDGAAWGIRLTCIETPADSGALGGVLAASRFAEGAAVLVHPGRLLLDGPLKTAIETFRANAVDALVVTGAGGDGPSRAVALEDRRLERLLAQVAGEGPQVVDTGVRLLGPRFFSTASADGDGNGAFSSLLRLLIAAGGRVAVAGAGDWWSFDGTLRGALEGNRRVLERLPAARHPAAAPDVSIQGRARIDPTAVIEGSTIRGPVVIGAGTRVRSAYVGPYTSIGEDVDIRGAEIENSIVLRRARIEYVGRRIEASIVGADACIRRDFSLPAALRLWVGDHAEVCLG